MDRMSDPKPRLVAHIAMPSDRLGAMLCTVRHLAIRWKENANCRRTLARNAWRASSSGSKFVITSSGSFDIGWNREKVEMLIHAGEEAGKRGVEKTPVHRLTR